MRRTFKLIKRSFPTILVVTIVLAGAVQVLADLLTIDFESYSLGTVHGQDGWSKTGAYDVAVVSNTYGYATFGTKSLRISNAITSGSFGDHAFSKPLTEEAGETGAYVPVPTAVRHPYFVAEWDFASTVPGAHQPGLSVVASPDRGDGGRMSWVQMLDTPGGLEVNFYDYQDVPPYGSAGTISDGFGAGDTFVFTTVATGLDRTVPHTIKIEMFLVDGPHNDIVNLYVDGVLEHTGTSWEDYFRWVQGPGGPEMTAPVHESRVIRSILFRVGGTPAPATSGFGFLIDNFSTYSGPVPCTTDCYVDDAIGNDANGGTNPTTDAKKTIQNAVNTVNVAGTVHVAGGTYVEQVEIDKTVTVQGAGATTIVQSPNTLTKYFTTSANNYPIIWVHDADGVVIEDLVVDGAGKGNSNYRFVGIGYDNAGGTIEDVEIKDIRNTPIDGSQHGVGILANSAEGTARTLIVNRCDIHDYQKNGSTFNGADLTATITNNTVTGAGAVNFIAQNGIQVSFGATAEVNNNNVSGHSYTPATYVSAGMLLYFSDANTDDNDLIENQAGIYHINGSGTHKNNEVGATATGTGSPYFWGIIADPGEIKRAIPSPFDAGEGATSGLKKSGANNALAASYTYLLDQNTLTSDGSSGGVGIGAYVFGTDVLDFTATANTVTKWEDGFELYKDPGATLNANIIDCNQIYDNTAYGVINYTGVVANAVGNWWGDPTGPTHASNVGGVGDVVSDDVTFAPWGTDATCGGSVAHNFVFLANTEVKIERTKQVPPHGAIHSNGNVIFKRGDPSEYDVNVTAIGNVKIIGDENTIDGDVTAGGVIKIDEGSVITGTATSGGSVANVAMPALAYSAGGPNHTIAKGKFLALAPGSYGTVTIYKGATLKFSSGDYYFDQLLDSGTDAVFVFDVASGPVTINVVTKLEMAKDLEFRILVEDENGSDKVTVNTMQSTKLSIGKESYILCSLNAPNAAVVMGNNTQFRGSISANSIEILRDCLWYGHNSPGDLPGPDQLPKFFDDGDDEEEDAELANEQAPVTDYALEQNYPNPFNPSTKISFAMPERGIVQLRIFNEAGQLVRTLMNHEMAQGRHELVWDGRNQNGETVATGVYLYRLTLQDQSGAAVYSETRRMSFVK